MSDAALIELEAMTKQADDVIQETQKILESVDPMYKEDSVTIEAQPPSPTFRQPSTEPGVVGIVPQAPTSIPAVKVGGVAPIARPPSKLELGRKSFEKLPSRLTPSGGVVRVSNGGYTLGMNLASTAAPSQQQVPEAQEFVRIKSLGKGAFAEVILVQDRKMWAHHAIKQFTHDYSQVIKEMRAFDKQKIHPNVVRVYQRVTFEGKPGIVMEYVDGMCVGKLIDALKTLPSSDKENAVKCIAYQALLGLDYLHYKKIYHRDLKPDNMLISRKGVVKISDFNTAKVSEADSAGRTIVSGDTFNGSLAYISPERWCADPNASVSLSKCDIWGLGLSLYEVVTGLPVPTVQCKTQLAISNFISSQAFDDHVAGALSGLANTQLKELIQLMLQRDPSKRPSASALLQTEIFAQEILLGLTSVPETVLQEAMKLLQPKFPGVTVENIHNEYAKYAGEKEDAKLCAKVLSCVSKWSTKILEGVMKTVLETS